MNECKRATHIQFFADSVSFHLKYILKIAARMGSAHERFLLALAPWRNYSKSRENFFSADRGKKRRRQIKFMRDKDFLSTPISFECVR